MTRFEKEISGSLGTYWKASAEKELEVLASELEAGKITIDDDGVARNCIGRVVMDDLVEKLAYITDRVNVKATNTAREAEVAQELAAYRANRQGYSEEELAEMRQAFGAGARVRDIITGKEITL